jgi:hypothetical protein
MLLASVNDESAAGSPPSVEGLASEFPPAVLVSAAVASMPGPPLSIAALRALSSPKQADSESNAAPAPATCSHGPENLMRLIEDCSSRGW